METHFYFVAAFANMFSKRVGMYFGNVPGTTITIKGGCGVPKGI